MTKEIQFYVPSDWRSTMANCEGALDLIAFVASYQAEEPLSRGGCYALGNLVTNVNRALARMTEDIEKEAVA